MQNLILTHNTMVYAVASLVTLTLGSFFVCSHVHEKWLKQFNYSLMDVNALIKGFIACLGFVVISPSNLFKGDLFMELISLFTGCITGYLFLRFELLTIKMLPYQQRFNSEAESGVKTPTANNIRNILKPKTEKNRIAKNQYSYLATGIAGGAEELLFRGFLTLLCLSLPDFSLSIICLFLVNVVFALSHINLGYIHIITKFVLGLICLFSFL